MTDGRRIVGNFLSLAFAQAVGFAFGLGTTVLLARNLGPESFGILGFGQAFIAFAGILVVLGTDVYGAREIARDSGRTGSLVSEVLGLRLLIAATAIPVLIAIAMVVGDAGPRSIVLSLQALGLLATVITLDFVFQGLQRMGPIAARQSVAAALVFVGTVLLVHRPADIYIAAVLPFFAISVTGIWLMRRMHRDIARLRVRFSPSAWRRWLPVAIPIGLGGLSITVFQYVDILMLGFFVADADVGRYVALARLYIVVVTIGNLLSAAFAPVLAKLGTSEFSARADAYRPFAIAVLVMGAPAGAAMAAFPGEAIRLFFGDAYVGDPGVLSVVMISAVIFLATIATSTALVAWDDQLYRTKVLSAAAGVNIVLNSALIPFFGLWGASIATLLSVLFLLAAESRRLAARHGIAPFAPLVRIAVLLVFGFGGSALVRYTIGHDALPESSLIVLAVFGGGGAVVFFAGAAAINLIEPGRILRLIRRP